MESPQMGNTEDDFMKIPPSLTELVEILEAHDNCQRSVKLLDRYLRRIAIMEERGEAAMSKEDAMQAGMVEFSVADKGYLQLARDRQATIMAGLYVLMCHYAKTFPILDIEAKAIVAYGYNTLDVKWSGGRHYG